ncbi:MAG: undecaprenyl/decaprenyl-phosphate alpha-N-acetylglucosaminyl 1-phosphate transferase [Phycisphaerales bacterium]|nr:undecaprenyl/decaprenyl-phosphate alpha-N-acetylglucosaminyl 1-phosphate transferase [Phycisphaerales bacterium]
MVAACLALLGLSFLLSMTTTWVVRALSRHAGAIDSLGVPGQVKAPRRAIPNTGGIGVFLAIALPIGAGVILALVGGEGIASLLPESVTRHLPGMRDKAPLVATLLACLGVLHVMGLVDDRRPMGPWLKLGVMTMAAGLIATTDGTRLLTMLDAYPGGYALSFAVTVLWFIVVTNAMNFIDNMDGLSAGVAAIAGSCFLVAALVNGQWFVAACLSLVVGSSLGFLLYNFPPASIFMGDGGSLTLGFLLAFLTTRTTYYSSDDVGGVASGPWYAVLMPLVVLAVPLYDFASVVLIRLRQGRSPFVGDLQHLSHRIVERGLSRRASVLVIWGATGVTGLAGIVLGSLKPWQAAVIGGQVVLLLGVLALFEYARAREQARVR